MRWSGSKLPLLRACGYSARPDVEVPADVQSEPARRGVARHLAFEHWLSSGVTSDPEGCDWAAPPSVVRETFLRSVRDLGLGGTVEVEIPIVLDVETGHSRFSRYKRTHDDPEARPSEIRLIADLISVSRDPRPEHPSHTVVVDWKTGRHRAEAVSQLDGLVLAARAARGILAYVDDYGAITHTIERTYDEIDHAATLAWMRGILERERTAEPIPGPHCRDLFCPLLGLCPATAPALVAAGVPTITLAPETPEEARALFLAREVARGWYTRADDALRQYVDQRGEVPLGDGRAYGVNTSTRETITLTPEAIAAVDIPADALRVSTSKSAINAALGAKRGRELLAQLGELGCLTVTTTRRYEAK